MLTSLDLVVIVEGSEHVRIAGLYVLLDEVVMGQGAGVQFVTHLVIEGSEGWGFPPEAVQFLLAASMKFWFRDFIAFTQLVFVGFSKYVSSA